MELGLRTQFDFLLPKGYVDEQGGLHRRGEMRLATARDEIEPLRDTRVAQNEAYLTVLVLERVITRIGDIIDITPEVIEGLFAADLAYLQDFYGIANFGDQSQLPLAIDDDALTGEVPTEDATGADLALVDDPETNEAPRRVLQRGTVEELPPTGEA